MSISCLAILSCRCILNTRQPCSRRWSEQSLDRKMNSKSWIYQSLRSLLAIRTKLGSRSNTDTRDLGQTALLSMATTFLGMATETLRGSSGTSLWIPSQILGHRLGMNSCGRWGVKGPKIFCSSFYFSLFLNLVKWKFVEMEISWGYWRFFNGLFVSFVNMLGWEVGFNCRFIFWVVKVHVTHFGPNQFPFILL